MVSYYQLISEDKNRVMVVVNDFEKKLIFQIIFYIIFHFFPLFLSLFLTL